MAIRLFTDISCDLPFSFTSAHDVSVLPIIITVDGRDHLISNNPADPDSIDWHDCYEKLRNGAESKTAQIPIETFRERFSSVLEAGDDIVYSAFSSGLSGTYNTACLIAQELMAQYPGRSVRVVDSLCASLGHGLLVWLAVDKLESGATLDELEAYMNEVRLQSHHWFTVDDLHFLRRGGRVSQTSAVVGSVLNIKPVLNVDDEGHLIPKQKVQGRKRALRTLAEHMEAEWDRDPKYPVLISHGDCPAEAEQTARMVEEHLGRKVDMIAPISPIIGSHSGPGTVALFFMSGKARG